LKQAKSEYERKKKQLYESKIVPKAEFEKVEAISQYRPTSNYQGLAAGVAGDGSNSVAPI